jgi:hypothetical protein
LILLLAAIAAGGIFAQEKTADVKKFWVSGEVSLVGAGARGEYMLTPKISVGLNAYWTSLFFVFNDIGINAVGRYYPWGKMFYAGLGVGYATHSGDEEVTVDWGWPLGEVTDKWIVVRKGFGIVPEVGWKIDLGNPGGFYLNPQAQLPLIIGKRDLDNKSGVSVGFRVACGAGWAF